MKVAGFFLLVAGWCLSLATVVLLRAAAPQAVFVLAALAVQAGGMILVARSHTTGKGERE
jgi:hypothetical protein